MSSGNGEFDEEVMTSSQRATWYKLLIAAVVIAISVLASFTFYAIGSKHIYQEHTVKLKRPAQVDTIIIEVHLDEDYYRVIQKH